jgi:hypothetical protein
MIDGLRGATIWSEDLNHLLPFYRGRPRSRWPRTARCTAATPTPRVTWSGSAPTTSTATGGAWTRGRGVRREPDRPMSEDGRGTR